MERTCTEVAEHRSRNDFCNFVAYGGQQRIDLRPVLILFPVICVVCVNLVNAVGIRIKTVERGVESYLRQQNSAYDQPERHGQDTDQVVAPVSGQVPESVDQSLHADSSV